MKFSYEDYQVVLEGLSALGDKIKNEDILVDDIKITKEMIDNAWEVVNSIGTY